MGCSDSRMEPMKTGLPFWVHSLEYRSDMAAGFGGVAEGLNQLTANRLIYSAAGSHTTYGARWCIPMPSGKHVFEVDWPVQKNRGTNSCIGVATDDVPLSSGGRVSLVGINSKGWCVDLSRRRAIHTNTVGKRARFCPDRFFIYVDIEGGKISISEDINKLGHHAGYDDGVVSNIQSDQDDPLYLMVSCAKPQETMEVVYKGSHVAQGGFDLVNSIMQSEMNKGAPPPEPSTY